MRFTILGLAGLLAVSACRQGGMMHAPAAPEGFRYASASPDCAPWDGRAITILLSDRPGTDSGGISGDRRPLVRVSIYPRSASVGRQSYEWPADPQAGSAIRCLAGADCESATRGIVTITNGLPDTVVLGSIQLHFADGSGITGGFRARWIQRQVLCG